MLENIQYQHHEAYRYGHSSAIPKQKPAEQCISPMISGYVIICFHGAGTHFDPTLKTKGGFNPKTLRDKLRRDEKINDFMICV